MIDLKYVITNIANLYTRFTIIKVDQIWTRNNFHDKFSSNSRIVSKSLKWFVENMIYDENNVDQTLKRRKRNY